MKILRLFYIYKQIRTKSEGIPKKLYSSNKKDTKDIKNYDQDINEDEF